MSKIALRVTGIAVGLLLIFAIYQAYPIILYKVLEWQKSFHKEMSSSLLSINENQQAGWILIAVSFVYGIFHAVGPGHGKFILTSYLSLEETKLNQAMKLTFLSSLAQGLVAIGLVSIIVVVFTLSKNYFNDALHWVERGSFALMITFGLYWVYRAYQKYQQSKPKPVVQTAQATGFKINKITLDNSNNQSVAKPHVHHFDEDGTCGCGHKHTPDAAELDNATDWKAQLMIILSIGSRPCSGAILVLFLAYTLDLYMWGVFATLAMAFGTGLTLTAFAIVVLFARNRAINMSKWYVSLGSTEWLTFALKACAGLALVGLGIVLLHGSFLEEASSGGVFFQK